jgi:hypothetical protein
MASLTAFDSFNAVKKYQKQDSLILNWLYDKCWNAAAGTDFRGYYARKHILNYGIKKSRI